MDESGINLNFDLDESDQERILEIVKSDLVDSVLSELPVSEFPNFDFYELRSKTVSLSTSLNESPTLKTEVVRSRTQLKQQLMRDQELFKEQERRRLVEEEAAIAAQSLEEPISIPVNVSNVQVPEHVLQVSSNLQNPTRYHILAKQKHQVLKFLNLTDTDDFVSKFDAQKATLQLKHQQQLLQLQINQKQQVQDHYKQQMLQQKQLQEQQRIFQRRQLQKRRELQLQYQEQWHFNKLQQIQNMEQERRLEEMQIMEYEQIMHQKRQDRQIFYLRGQQHDDEMEQLQDLRAQHQLEQQQLLHQHLMEKQQLQQQFQLEKQQLQQQQEQMKLQQQLLRHQRQKELLKRAQAEDKAEGEALLKIKAEIRAKRRGLSHGEPSLEVKTEDLEQKILQEVAQAMEQAQAREQPPAQLQLLGQPQIQEPQQDEACALPLDTNNISPREALHRFIYDLTPDPSVAEDKSADDMVKYDVYYAMVGNLSGPFQWGQSEPHSLYKDDILNMNWTKSCPSELEHYEKELSPYSLHDAKSRIRKDNHNIVERRRRSNINDRIKELADLLPKVNERYYEVVKDSKNNKGGILKSAVEYIKYLKLEMINLAQMEINYYQVVEEKLDLSLKLEEMKSKVKEMLMRYPTFTIVEPYSFTESIVKDDEMDKNESDKNESDKNESSQSEKSESSSSQGEFMEEDNSDKDETC